MSSTNNSKKTEAVSVADEVASSATTAVTEAEAEGLLAVATSTKAATETSAAIATNKAIASLRIRSKEKSSTVATAKQRQMKQLK